MENKIIYLKTYVITIVAIFIIFITIISGLVYYYESIIQELENTVTKNNNTSGITILQDTNTSLENVKAK